MPFHSILRLSVEIHSKSGVLSFEDSFSNIVSFTGSKEDASHAPNIRGLSRTKTGDKLDDDVWDIHEVTAKYGDCVPGVRLFQLVLIGEKFGRRLTRREKEKEKEKETPALALYRSIMSDDTVRFTIYLGDKPYVLDVQLSYRLERAGQGRGGAEADC